MSRNIKIFEELLKAFPSFKLVEDTMIVEAIKKEEVKSKGGIILQGSKTNHDGFEQNRPVFARVIAVNTRDREPSLKPGDVVLLPAGSVQWWSHFGPLVSYEDQPLGYSKEEFADKIIVEGPDSYEGIMIWLANRIQESR